MLGQCSRKGYWPWYTDAIWTWFICFKWWA